MGRLPRQILAEKQNVEAAGRMGDPFGFAQGRLACPCGSTIITFVTGNNMTQYRRAKFSGGYYKHRALNDYGGNFGEDFAGE